MQLFLPQHYAAFDDPKPDRNDDATIAERAQVRDVFLQLDDLLWPFIETTDWDLHQHRHRLHYVSSHHFVYLDGGKPIVEHIGGMWLHYGKSPEQLDFVKLLGRYE